MAKKLTVDYTNHPNPGWSTVEYDDQATAAMFRLLVQYHNTGWTITTLTEDRLTMAKLHSTVDVQVTPLV